MTVTFQDEELLSAERSEVQRQGMSAHSASPSNLEPDIERADSNTELPQFQSLFLLLRGVSLGIKVS